MKKLLLTIALLSGIQIYPSSRHIPAEVPAMFHWLSDHGVSDQDRTPSLLLLVAIDQGQEQLIYPKEMLNMLVERRLPNSDINLRNNIIEDKSYLIAFALYAITQDTDNSINVARNHIYQTEIGTTLKNGIPAFIELLENQYQDENQNQVQNIANVLNQELSYIP